MFSASLGLLDLILESLGISGTRFHEKSIKDFYGTHTIVCRNMPRFKHPVVSRPQSCVEKNTKKGRCWQGAGYHIEEVEREVAADGRSAGAGAEKNAYGVVEGRPCIGAPGARP